ncbi:MAG: thrombospondin type 3 repeat-containing protein [bacterium]
MRKSRDVVLLSVALGLAWLGCNSGGDDTNQNANENAPPVDAGPDASDLPDRDGDGVPDDQDNCPDEPNPTQADTDLDGEGDACELQDGTVEHPFIIPGDPLLPDYRHARDTSDALSDRFDSYPGHEDLDESGPEYVYLTRLEQRIELRAWIPFPEPAGTDVDLHLLTGLEPLALVGRGHYEVTAVLEPGLYYLVLDTYVFGGVEQAGPYDLTVSLTARHAGTLDDPIPPNGDPDAALALPFEYRDSRDTTEALSDAFDAYPGYEQLDESGPEYIYRFRIDEPARFAAAIAFEEPAGTDIDLHLLSEVGPVSLVTRGNTTAYALLEAGTYWLVLDTYVSAGVEQLGPYDLWMSIRPRNPANGAYFNDYVLAAVDYLYASYRLLGYDSAVLTHDIPYPGGSGNQLIETSGGAKTMCVAAALEVMLTAMHIYAEDTGDDTVFDFLPERSWESLATDCIKAYIWVNYDLPSAGTADAVAAFGMGELVVFEDLQPGSFINLNRTTGTGHAVVFLSFIDILGNESATWHPDVIGFRYFSSQGGLAEGAGGLDYRYAIFSDYGAPEMPYKRDLNVIYSTDPGYLNTGMMWHPSDWIPVSPKPRDYTPPSMFDAQYFDGVTADD